MQIRRVKLTNVAAHEHLELELGTGLIGFFGRNGAGKTTTINAMYAGLTGDYGRFKNGKSGMIRRGISSETKSAVELDVLHGDTAFTLTRGLQAPVSNVLKLQGDSRPITNDREIKRIIGDLFGLKRQILGDYVFVDQWSMFDFLAQEPAERAKAFQYLSGTQRAIRIYKALSDYLPQVEAELDFVEDNSADIEAAIAEAKSRIAEFEQAREPHQANLLSDEGAAGKQARIAAHSQRKDLQARVKTYDAYVTSWTVEVDKARTAAEMHQRTVDECHQLVERKAQGSTEASKVVDAWGRRRMYLAAKQDLEYALHVHKADLAKQQRNEPKLPAGVNLDDERPLNARVIELSAELTNAKKVVDIFGSSGTTTCPTCGASAAMRFDFLEQCRQQLLVLPNLVNLEKAKLAQITLYKSSRGGWETNMQLFQRNVDQAQERLASLTVVEEPTESETTAAAAMQELSTAQRQLSSLLKKQSELSSKYAWTKGNLETVERQRAETATKLEQIGEITDDEVAECTEALAKSAAAKIEITKLTASIVQVQLVVKEKQGQLDRLRERLAKHRKYAQLRDHLLALREVVHHNNLPKVFSQELIHDLAGEMARHLEAFGSPFTAIPGPDLTFEVRFPGQVPGPAESLSGGQKVMLAMALRRAIASTCASEIGMLTLDEPTAGLDEENVAYLHGCLESFAREVKTQGAQVLVITHSQHLRSAFSQVIDL